MSPQTSGEKHNLVIVQAFPANSTLSQGAIAYLEVFFNVYFIDLPGFHPSVKPLEEITIENYVQYVQEKIAGLSLDSYILSGISFGFVIANKVKVDNRCKLIFAIEPYLGYKYIKMTWKKRMYIKLTAAFFSLDSLVDKFWHKRWFRDMLCNIMNKTKPVINVVIKELDPRTLIETARLVINYDEKIEFNGAPYVLMLNPRCHLIKFEKTLYEFVDNIDNKDLRVILTTVDHYPKDPTYEYFKEHLSMNELESLFNFSNYLSRNLQ